MDKPASPEDFFSRYGTTEHFDPRSEDDRWDEQAGENAEDRTADNKRRSRRRTAPDAPSEPIEPRLIFPSLLRGKPIPAMEWLVDQWIPMREVTLLYGDGGVGKTLLAQQLQACTALGKPWCAIPVHRCKSLSVFCEDDDDELHRRQNDIQRHLQTDFDDDRLDGMCWWSRKGQDNLLGTFDHEGKLHPAPFYDAIVKAAKDHGARLVILDTAADLFAGNENDRGQVRQFIGLLSRMAMACDAAVVLCAHPSRSGMATGTQDSGSTGWSNSARSRLALERPKADGDAEADTNERLLTKKKSNRSSIGDSVKLRWHDGVIVSTRAAEVISATVIANALDADAVFLSLMAQVETEGRSLSASANAPNYAPKLLSKHPGRQGFGKRDFDAAMQRLFASGRIINEEYGRPNDRGRPRRIAAVKGHEDE